MCQTTDLSTHSRALHGMGVWYNYVAIGFFIVLFIRNI